MNARMVTCAILVGLGWAAALAQGQDLPPAPGVQPPPIQRDVPPGSEAVPASSFVPPGVGLPGAGVPDGPPAMPTGLSDWILYRRPGSGCCDPGPLKPLYTEAYIRVGPSVPVGGNYLGRELVVGWSFEGGVRALFFNRPSSAWVVDLGIVNTNNGALSPGTPVTLEIFQPNVIGTPTLSKVPVTIRTYNQTMVSIGIGKEYYVFAPADNAAGRWRIGWDGGGRYGSSSMTFNEIRHRTRVIEGAFLAAHTDYEIPCGCCYIAFGVRAEWSYTWSTILQKQSDLQAVTGLATFSVRY